MRLLTLVAEPSLSDLEEQYLRTAFRSTFISGGAGSYKDRLEKEFAAMCGYVRLYNYVCIYLPTRGIYYTRGLKYFIHTYAHVQVQVRGGSM